MSEGSVMAGRILKSPIGWAILFVLVVMAFASVFRDRAPRDAAGAGRPDGQARPGDQRLQARRALRRHRRGPDRAHPWRRGGVPDRQARAESRHGEPAGPLDRPTAAAGRCVRALPHRQSAADVPDRARRPAAGERGAEAPSSARRCATSSAGVPSPRCSPPSATSRWPTSRPRSEPRRASIWRADRRRADQARRTARRHPARQRLQAHGNPRAPAAGR